MKHKSGAEMLSRGKASKTLNNNYLQIRESRRQRRWGLPQRPPKTLRKVRAGGRSDYNQQSGYNTHAAALRLSLSRAAPFSEFYKKPLSLFTCLRLRKGLASLEPEEKLSVHPISVFFP